MELTAATLKQFFKSKGIPVRVKSNTSYVQVWIQCEDNGPRGPLVFKYEFPLEFRVKCLEIIYPGMKGNENGSAGNIGAYSLSMHRHEWIKALAD